MARLSRFFNTLFASLSRGARAIFQFYPESDDQVNMIMSSATKAGFSGGLVVDYPNSRKAKKFYLCLMTGPGGSSAANQPKALGTELGEGMDVDEVQYDRSRRAGAKEGKRGGTGSKRKKGKETDKDWILRKKSLYRQRGKEGVPSDSKWVRCSEGWILLPARLISSNRFYRAGSPGESEKPSSRQITTNLCRRHTVRPVITSRSLSVMLLLYR